MRLFYRGVSDGRQRPGEEPGTGVDLVHAVEAKCAVSGSGHVEAVRRRIPAKSADKGVKLLGLSAICVKIPASFVLKRRFFKIPKQSPAGL